MIHTIWNEHDRRALADRLATITPDAKGKWGRLDAPAMVVHVTDALRMGTGDIACTPRASPFRVPVIKTLVMFHLPWPKGAPTAPELLSRKSESWDAEVARFRSTLDTFVQRPRNGPWPVHVVFGSLSGEQWGRLMYRHIDHHFTQFGT